MYGVIYFWRVLPDKLADHVDLVRATLQAERERSPEVLLNLVFGPAADGTCAEVQVYADDVAQRGFGERVRREDAALARLWDRYHEVCDPQSWRTVRFDGMPFLEASFVRAALVEGLRLSCQ